jgi:hypothetical protein
MPNYWLGIMAVAFALAMAAWIALVFRAGRVRHRVHENSPHREVIGGAFEAHEGGRQVMPDPNEPLPTEVHEKEPPRGARP